MKPVKQNRIYPKKGNCFSGCLASMLNMEIEDVFDGDSETHIDQDDGDWWFKLRDWLHYRNIGWVTVQYAPHGYAIAVGPSPRERDGVRPPHAVIVRNGDFYHDPHPDNTFLNENRIDYYIVLYPLNWGLL